MVLFMTKIKIIIIALFLMFATYLSPVAIGLSLNSPNLALRSNSSTIAGLPNLPVNGEFTTTDLSAWTISPSSAGSVVGTDYLSSPSSLYLACSCAQVTVKQTIPSTSLVGFKGHKVMLTFHVKDTSSNPSKDNFNVQIWKYGYADDGEGYYTGWHYSETGPVSYSPVTTSTNTYGWQTISVQYEIQVDPSESISQMYIELTVYSSVSSIKTFVDDVMLSVYESQLSGDSTYGTVQTMYNINNRYDGGNGQILTNFGVDLSIGGLSNGYAISSMQINVEPLSSSSTLSVNQQSETNNQNDYSNTQSQADSNAQNAALVGVGFAAVTGVAAVAGILTGGLGLAVGVGGTVLITGLFAGGSSTDLTNNYIIPSAGGEAPWGYSTISQSDAIANLYSQGITTASVLDNFHWAQNDNQGIIQIKIVTTVNYVDLGGCIISSGYSSTSYTCYYGFPVHTVTQTQYISVDTGASTAANNPSAPSGPSLVTNNGIQSCANTPQTFKFSGTDPNNYRVDYEVNWGDGSSYAYYGPYSSGSTNSISYTYSKCGTFNIQYKVVPVDTDGNKLTPYASAWSPTHTITMRFYPIVTLESPCSGCTETSTFSFKAQATSSVPVTEMDFFVKLSGSVYQGNYITSGFTSSFNSNTGVYLTSYAVSVNPASFPVDTYTLSAYAYFTDGLSNSNSESIYLDYTPPTSGGGGGGTGGCVSLGTNILMSNNRMMPIQTINVGDWVMGYNISNNKLTPVQVTFINKTLVSSLLDINNGLLKTTLTDQPIYIRNTTYQGWLLNPDELKIGDQIFNPIKDTWINIYSLGTLSQHPYLVFDLRTSTLNNYIGNEIFLDIKVM